MKWINLYDTGKAQEVPSRCDAAVPSL